MLTEPIHDPNKIRVITVVGHVDHGKTTFVDSLLAANNIISSRMAGKIRYLDSREDEQERGITMESSAVALRFDLLSYAQEGSDPPIATPYIINLIDTPGHVDFSTEVSTASRLCDGALVVIDAVEGVCTQTIAVLRQVLVDRIQPILVINKMDRLVIELKFQPLEAYHYLSRLLEQVNAVIGDFFTTERMNDDYLRWQQRHKDAENADGGFSSDVPEILESSFEEKDDAGLYFSPDRGNVIFASAIDGWAFRVGNFARIFASRLGTKENVLRKVLWGDYFFDPKSKRILGRKHLKGRNIKPLFVQLVLENLWAVYTSVLTRDAVKTAKIVSSLNLSIPSRELQAKDTRQVLSAIFSRWLPLATTCVQAVVEVIPSPVNAQGIRLPRMLAGKTSSVKIEENEITTKLHQDLFTCNSSPDAYGVAYVSKMFAVAKSSLPQSSYSDQQKIQAVGESAGDEVLLGFARIYSGTLSVGATVYVILPKLDLNAPANQLPNKLYLKKAKVDALYVMMGRELVPVSQIRGGNVFAIAGLQGIVWRNATLCFSQMEQDIPTDDEVCTEGKLKQFVNLGSLPSGMRPFVRVALEPADPANMSKLISGLKILSQSDPCVETLQQPTGEHVIITAGELHFERCLRDLRERFAKIDIQASMPIVPFRETILYQGLSSKPVLVQRSENDCLNFTLHVSALPPILVNFLKEHSTSLEHISRRRNDTNSSPIAEFPSIIPQEIQYYENLEQDSGHHPTVGVGDFWNAFHKTTEDAGSPWRGMHVWAFGPEGKGSNILVDGRTTKVCFNRGSSVARDLDPTLTDRLVKDLEDSFEAGFQTAMLQGPLCSEPLEGVACTVESISVNMDKLEGADGQLRRSQLISSNVSTFREALKEALLQLPLRLMLAMYSCDIQTSSDVLGKVYGVVARRHGRVVSEDLKEGTSFFNIQAFLPVVESFGFADEIRKKTSGAATPQLLFGGYEILNIDPFWVPTTTEELEDLGEKADRMNIAKAYVDSVRERKGLFVDKKIVQSAEKQRTLKH